MSSRRLQEDYRRILGITEDVRGIDPALPRMRIAGARGIYQQGDGSTKSGAAPSEDTEPVTPDETDNNLNADGSGQGDQNTGDGIGGGSGGNLDDGWSVIDPDDPLVPNIDPFDNTFGDGWSTGGPVTFQDCETEQCIQIVEVGGYVPPEGWDDAGDPPPVPEYEEGFYWQQLFGAAGWTPAEACAASGNYGPFPGTSGGLVCRTNADGTGVGRQVTKEACMPTGFCASGTPIPKQTSWPADNCIQLAPNADGNLAPSQYENPNDMTAKYSEPKSQLTLCNSSGESIQLNKNIHGGWTYLNLDQSTWRSTDANGKPRGFGSSSSHRFEIFG